MFRQGNSVYEFGPFRLDLAEKALSKDGESVALTPKAFDTLLILIEKNGRLVEKEELMKQLWPDTFVEENSLSQNIYLVRKALGEESQGARYIETVPRRGYRFSASVREISGGDTAIAEGAETRILVERNGSLAGTLTIVPALSSHLRRFSRTSLFALGALLTLLAIWLIWSPPRRSVAGFEAKSIAVLPFKPLGALAADASDAQLGLGITDAMISRFSGIRQVTARPTSAIFRYAGQSYDPSEVGRELNVDAVLEGTVQRVGDRVRVTVQLIDVQSGQPLWSDRFDEKFTGVFAVQDAISEQVAQALEWKLTTDERKHLTWRPTENPEAYQAYARGLFFWNKRTEDGLSRSIEYFNEAIAKDPHYALAWAGLADAYAVTAYLRYKFTPANDAYRKAEEAATKALEIDQTMAEAYTALSVVRAYRDSDLPGAEKEIKKAITLKENSATAHQRYSIYLRDQGRLSEALGEIQRAHELDPVSLTIGSNLAFIHYLRRDYDQAASCARKVLETEPDYFQSLVVLGPTLQQQQKSREAIALLEKVREQQKGKASVYYNALEALGHAYAVAGQRAAAERVIAELKACPEDKDDTTYRRALIRAGLGELDKAFALLEANSGDWTLPPVGLTLDPRFDNLRADPRYEALMRKRFGQLALGIGR
jgi:DNA-binding winged helix-turn-helix (wHTH) protein/TolB-like protein/Flp pilus assembly protein TadD